ncbi:MAG: FHA domain-containing protein [Chloroflexota bacterium]
MQFESATTIGRHVDNTYTFSSDFISGHHATLQYHDAMWWVTDLDSMNGTVINDVAIQSPTPLHYGDTITFGDCQFQLQSDEQKA